MGGIKNDFHQSNVRLDGDRLDNIDCGIGVITYKVDNLLLREIMEKVGEIIEARGAKYLHDRLEITLLSFK